MKYKHVFLQGPPFQIRYVFFVHITYVLVRQGVAFVCVCVNMILLLAAPPHPMKAKSEECEALYGLIWVNGSNLTMQIAGLVQDSISKASESDLHLAW